MTIIRVRLGEMDRKEYGRDGELLPDVLPVDLERLKDLTAAELETIDRALDTPLALFIEPMEKWSLTPAQLCRVVAWLAVHLHGSPASFADFQPRLLRAVFEREVPADNPPAGTSESSSEGAPAGSSSAA